MEVNWPGPVPDPDVEPAVSLPPPPRPQHVPGRKKGTACARCRSQKIRCDDERPSCSNCARTGHPCIRANDSNNPDAVTYITQMEARLRCLEESLRRTNPAELDKAPPVDPQLSLAPNTAWPLTDSSRTHAGLSNDVSVQSWSLQQTPANHGIESSQAIDHGGNIERVVSSQVEPVGRSHGASQETRPSVPLTSPPYTNTRSPGAGTHISPDEPLAHEVGMLSLANSKESKYLGPSSGVPFARLIFSAIPQSQGLPSNWATAGGEASTYKPSQARPLSPNWASEVDLQHLVDAYFETYQPFYPFLDEDIIADHVERLYKTQSAGLQSLQMPQPSEVDASLSSFHSVQVLLIIALGARILEVRLSTELSSERYLATAMQRIGNLALHDSIEGLQIMLLLALASFYFEDGPNAWFLTCNIIASCLDLGFQRRNLRLHRGFSPGERRHVVLRENLRRGVFWSAYSLERTLSVVLGRPLTLRDEAIDIEFPGENGTRDSETGHTDHVNQQSDSPAGDLSPGQWAKRPRMSISPYCAAQNSFRFDQITAEIKLMLHRVVNLPTTFPWPTDLDTWQVDVQNRCESLLEKLTTDLRRGFRRSSSDIAIRNLELKYHHCLMLLCRPSPAIAQPTTRSWKTCYSSAVSTILINSELHRFSKLSNSWLTAHTVFVSGITFLYCLWANHEIKETTSLDDFTKNAGACTMLLKYLAKTWSVAAEAVAKLEKLVQLTINVWKQIPLSSEVVAGHSLLSMAQAKDTSDRGQRRKDVHNNRGGDVPAPGSGLSGSEPSLEGSGGASVGLYSDSFFSELGDMSTWFDLEWLADVNIAVNPHGDDEDS